MLQLTKCKPFVIVLFVNSLSLAVHERGKRKSAVRGTSILRIIVKYQGVLEEILKRIIGILGGIIGSCL